MTGKELLKLIETGSKVVVRFTSTIEDLDNQFEEGMLAEIKKAYYDDEFGDFIRIFVDEQEFSNQNKNMEKPFWLDYKKYSEIHDRKNVLDFYDNFNNELINIEVVSSNPLVQEYLNSNSSISYTRWLEEKIQTFLN